MTNKELAQKLLDLLGGKDNVLANAACMTRLRVTVKDTGNVDTEGIKALDGVMGLVEDDTMQIVLGPGKVNKVLEEFSKLTGLAKGVADESVVDAAATNKAAQKAKYESKPVQAFLKKISNVFVALLPGIIAAGLINGICNVINVSTAGALAALLHIGTVSQGVSGLFGLLIVVPGQQLGYVAAMLLAYAAGFVLTWFFGVDEQKINEFFGE